MAVTRLPGTDSFKQIEQKRQHTQGTGGTHCQAGSGQDHNSLPESRAFPPGFQGELEKELLSTAITGIIMFLITVYF